MSNKTYFQAKWLVFQREVSERLHERAFEEIEDLFFDYGRFLERNPNAR